MVVAGAGTGKTKVIIDRILKRIQEDNLTLQNILVLTFLQKAANEMQERLDLALPLTSLNSWVSTFHSFCDRVLKAHALEAGIDPRYKIMTPIQAQLLMKDVLLDLPKNQFLSLGNPEQHIPNLHKYFGTLLEEGISPEKYSKYANSLPEEQQDLKITQLDLSLIYSSYQERKLIAGNFDYADLIYLTHKLFLERESIRTKYQEQFQDILVDEFQDTNYLQYQLVKLLTKSNNLIVVGDDDQSIYGFRGASVSNILRFKEDYPKCKVVELSINYRSSQEILDVAYRAIQFNNPQRLESILGINKALLATKTDSGKIYFLNEEDGNSEAARIVAEITKLNLEQGIPFSEIAILARSHEHSDNVCSHLTYKDIPFTRRVTNPWKANALVRDLLAFLTILVTPSDNRAVYQVLSSNLFKIEPEIITKLLEKQRNSVLTLFEVMKAEKSDKNLAQLNEFLNSHQNLTPTSPSLILLSICNEFGLFRKLENMESESDVTDAKSVAQLFEEIQTYERNVRSPSLADFILFHTVEEQPDGFLETSTELGVAVLTIHSAKGLEFEVVFILSLVKNRFPGTNRSQGIEIPEELLNRNLEAEDHIHEERRLFYVAMTRAKTQMYLCSAKKYTAKRTAIISPFVTEALPDFEKYILTPSQQLSLSESLLASSAGLIPQRTDHNLDHVTFSMLDTYNTCPLQYAFDYVQKVPKLPSATSTFGQTMHAVMQEFHQEILNGTKASKTRLLELYDQLWSSEGFTDKRIEKRRRQEGRESLEKYFENHAHLANPLHLEYTFRVPMGKVELRGKFDRIDKVGDNLRIIDYKTSKPPEGDKLQKDLQLSLYAYAATLLWPETKLPDLTLSIYNFNDSAFHDTTRDEDQLEKILEKVNEEVSGINSHEFQPKVSKMCAYCSFQLICNAYQSSIRVVE